MVSRIAIDSLPEVALCDEGPIAVLGQDHARSSVRYLFGLRLWLEAVKDLNAATVRMKERAREIPGRYFIFSTQEQKVLIALDTSPRSE